jgi:type VI protein secretion system component Hcp
MSNDVKKSWTMHIQGLDRYVRSGDSVRDKWDILSFNHGIYADPPVAGVPRRTQVFDMSIMRESDAATPVLMRLCQTGDILPVVLIEMRAEKDGKEIYRLTYELLNATIGRVNTSALMHSPDYRATEDIGIAFEKLRMKVVDGEQHAGAELTPSSP